MEQIKEMYAKVMDKKTFRENLSKVLFLNVRTIENSLNVNGSFKDKHLAKVKEALELQLQLDKAIRELIVKGWKTL